MTKSFNYEELVCKTPALKSSADSFLLDCISLPRKECFVFLQFGLQYCCAVAKHVNFRVCFKALEFSTFLLFFLLLFQETGYMCGAGSFTTPSLHAITLQLFCCITVLWRIIGIV